MIRLALSVSFLFLFAIQVRAESVGTGEGSHTQPTAKAAAKNTEAGEYGEDFVEVAALKGNSISDAMKTALPKHSWRNTQNILMGMKKIRCRMGGPSAKAVAIPALASEGYCNKKAELNNSTQVPVGSVYVYDNGRWGNTVVKVKRDLYFSNRKMSSPPPSRGHLVAIMVPGCGKRAKKCESAGKILAELKKLEKASDEAKSKHAEAMERIAESSVGPEEDNANEMNQILNPSTKRLEAEESCGYANAFRATDAFNECVEENLSK